MPIVGSSAKDRAFILTSALLAIMQKNNQRASSSKLLMTQPGKKEPEMPPPAPTAACMVDVAPLESGQPLCSPGLNPPIDVDVSGLTPIPPKDPAASLATAPEKGGQEARNRKANYLPQESLDKAPAGVHHKRKHPEVQQYFYQVNWPQEILQKWAKEKEDREKTLCGVISRDAAAASRNSAFDPALEGQNFVCEKPEDKGGLGIPQK